MAVVTQYQDPFHGAVWDQNDVDRLKNFLMHKSGKRFILRLRLDRPELPPNATAEQVALAAKRQEGYEEAIANIFDYLVTPAKPDERSNAYPNLDDEEAWPEDLREGPRKLATAIPNEAEAALTKQTAETEKGATNAC